MKRILAAVLMTIMLMTPLVSIAEANESFVFRGMPWLSPRDEVEEAFTAEGMNIFLKKKQFRHSGLVPGMEQQYGLQRGKRRLLYLIYES